MRQDCRKALALPRVQGRRQVYTTGKRDTDWPHGAMAVGSLIRFRRRIHAYGHRMGERAALRGLDPGDGRRQ